MKERKTWEKVAIVEKACKIVGGVMVAAGCCMMFLAGCGVVEGHYESARCAMMAENIDKSWISPSDLYPMQGVSYELQGRILSEDSNGAWYHGAIAANYGDVIEIRLAAIAANEDDISYDAVAEQASFMCSDGLQPMAVESRLNKVVLPDGSIADYLDEFSDERITYVAVGTYSVGRQDWWAGKGASTASAFINGDNMAKFVVVAPECQVDIRAAVGMIAAAIGFIIAGKFVSTFVYAKLARHIERASS